VAGEQVSVNEFAALFRDLNAWGRWGDDDERGALNHITAERITAAARLVRQGVTISLSWPLNTISAPDNRHPAEHRMTDLGGEGALKFAKDYIGVDYHNDTHTHIDALCHVGYDGTLYNGRPAATVTSAGAEVESIETLKDGLVGRGVLLDIPRLRELRGWSPAKASFGRISRRPNAHRESR